MSEEVRENTKAVANKAAPEPPFRTIQPDESTADTAFLLMGPTGTGKTALIGTLEGNGLVIAVKGTERGARIILAKYHPRIRVVEIDNWDQLSPVMDYLYRGKDVHGLRWVALDSFTALTTLAKGKVLGTKTKRGIDLAKVSMSLPKWGMLNDLLHGFFVDYNDLPMLKVVIAQEERYTDEVLGTIVGPETRPGLRGVIKQSMNGTFRTFIEAQGRDSIFRLRIRAHPFYETKIQVTRDKYEQLPDVLANPNLEELIQFIYGNGPVPEGAMDPEASASEEVDGLEEVE